MAWYIARSLETLRAQLNAMAPRRSTASDGGIGDAAHSARTSDHNPTSSGQVCARDLTHDPAGGLDGHWLARVLVASGDSRIKYIIWDRRIWTPGVGLKAYTGSNPHTKHLHLSVRAGALGDQNRPWNLGATNPQPNPKPEDDVFTPEDFNRLMWGNTFDDNGKGYRRNFAAFIKEMDAKLSGLVAAVAALSTDQDLTKDEVAKIVQDAVKQNIQITGEVKIGAAE